MKISVKVLRRVVRIQREFIRDGGKGVER